MINIRLSSNYLDHSLVPPNRTEYPHHPINITQYTSLYQPHYYTLPGPLFIIVQIHQLIIHLLLPFIMMILMVI